MGRCFANPLIQRFVGFLTISLFSTFLASCLSFRPAQSLGTETRENLNISPRFKEHALDKFPAQPMPTSQHNHNTHQKEAPKNSLPASPVAVHPE